MMPPPEEVTAIIDRAERIARGGRLDRLSREERRRLLAAAAFEYLRHLWDGATAPEPVPA